MKRLTGAERQMLWREIERQRQRMQDARDEWETEGSEMARAKMHRCAVLLDALEFWYRSNGGRIKVRD